MALARPDTEIEVVTFTENLEVVPYTLLPQNVTEECPDPASWWLVNKCCGARWGACNAHKMAYVESEKRIPPFLRELPVFRCSRCHALYFPDGNAYTWEQIR